MDQSREDDNKDTTGGAAENAPVGNAPIPTDNARTPVDIAKLDETFGAEARDEILLTFLRYTPPLIARLEKGIDEKDAGTAKDATHQLKGMSASIYADELWQHSISMERFAKSEPVDWESLKTSLPTLQEVYAKVKAYLATVLGTKMSEIGDV